MLPSVKEILSELDKELRKPDFACPYCGHGYNIGPDELYELVTYWGEGEPEIMECYRCDRRFQVNEHVIRTFTTFKLDDD